MRFLLSADTKAVIASLGKVNGAAGKETASQKKLRELTGQ